jgi:ParB-like chromosome segregation protein Spo0J
MTVPAIDRDPQCQIEAVLREDGMEDITIKVSDIYVPVKQRQAADAESVAEIAETMLETGKQPPITVRWDGKRHILVTGLERLEACKALGEEVINVTVVAQARKY